MGTAGVQLTVTSSYNLINLSYKSRLCHFSSDLSHWHLLCTSILSSPLCLEVLSISPA